MPKREQIVTPPTVADLPSDNPRPILVEFLRGFVSFAKRTYTPETFAQGKNGFSAWICAPMKRSGRLLKGKMISECWLSSLQSLWLLKRATISDAIAITPEISLSVGMRKKTASILNIPVRNCRGMRNCSTTGTDKSDQGGKPVNAPLSSQRNCPKVLPLR